MGNFFTDHEHKIRVPVSITQAERFIKEIDKFTAACEITQPDSKSKLAAPLDHFIGISKDMKLYFTSLIAVQKTLENGKYSPGIRKGLQQVFNKHLYVSDGTLKEMNPSQLATNVQEDVPREALQAEIDDLHRDLTYRRKQIEKMEQDTISLKKQLSDVSRKLSEEMNLKVGADEKNLENISILNRPMNIAQEYESVSLNAWLDAKSCLDNLAKDVPDSKKLLLLSKLWLVAQEVAKNKYNEMTKGIYTMISIHAEVGAVSNQRKLKGIVSAQNEKLSGSEKTDIHGGKPEEQNQTPQAVKIAINDFLRRTTDNVDISAVCEEIMVKLNQMSDIFITNIHEQNMEFKDLIKYVQVSGRIAWKMAAQRPPMYFDNETGIGKPLVEKDHELYYTSENPKDPSNVVLFYVNPALMHDNTVMVKGRVYVGKQ